MRVLIVHSGFGAKNIFKQPWLCSYEISRNLSKLGHKVSILTDVNHRDIKDIADVEIKVAPQEYLRFKLARNKILSDTDIIFYFGNSLSGIYLSRLNNQPPLVLYISSTYYSPHELWSLSPRELKSHWRHLLFSIFPFSYAVRLLNNPAISAIIVPNNALKVRLVEYGVNEEKINVFPIGFDPKEFISELDDNVAIRKRLGLPLEEFIITYLGSPLTIRGTDTLIKAAQRLKGQLKNFRVLILSRTDSLLEKREEKYLLSLINKFDLSDMVHFISGVLSRNLVKEYILASDIITLPFKIVQSEPPLGMLESMALGKPVITTNTCGLSEIIMPDCGLLVKPDDPDSLALAIYELASNSGKRLEMGRKAREYILRLPRWNDIMTTYEKFFQDKISGK